MDAYTADHCFVTVADLGTDRANTAHYALRQGRYILMAVSLDDSAADWSSIEGSVAHTNRIHHLLTSTGWAQEVPAHQMRPSTLTDLLTIKAALVDATVSTGSPVEAAEVRCEYVDVLEATKQHLYAIAEGDDERADLMLAPIRESIAADFFHVAT